LDPVGKDFRWLTGCGVPTEAQILPFGRDYGEGQNGREVEVDVNPWQSHFGLATSLP